MDPIVQCIPNFSEGRNTKVIDAIVDAVRNTKGVRLIDWSADPDHNRMVVTYIGSPEAVIDASLTVSETAVKLIDINYHDGVHPRIGAIDVLPFVPIHDIDMADCVEIAVKTANQIADLLNLPVFLYEYASPDRKGLPEIRKKAFKLYKPDFGPIEPHFTAGGVVIGARKPLIAYNIMLHTIELSPAKVIASELRNNEISGFNGVRALGLFLASRNITQVSMNITEPDITSINDVFSFVCKRASDFGVDIIESEIIGALPGVTAFRQIAETLKSPSLKPGQILLENWPS